MHNKRQEQEHALQELRKQIYTDQMAIRALQNEN